MTTGTILDKIVGDKRQAVAAAKEHVSLAALKERLEDRKPPRDFAAALRAPGLSLIAEVKQASPSRGRLCADFDPVKLARTYAAGGAAAVSVLTEADHFRGRLDYLDTIRKEIALPLLRKDFIFDGYQVYESAAGGADAILLIAAILDDDQLGEMLALAGSLRLASLVEVHDENEMMRALLAGSEIVGINNRDLTTFEVDTDTTRRLRLLAPEDVIVVSESGLKTHEDIKKMRECKVDAVLIGEALVTAPDIPARIKELFA